MANNQTDTRKRRQAVRRAGAALALALATFSGCEYMGVPGAKKASPPPVLVVQEKKIKEEPKPGAPIENPGAKDVEIYPPSGALFGSPSTTGKQQGAEKPSYTPKEGKYTLNFEDADLAEVAKVILGDTLKANYVISPKVAGKVSLQTTRALTDEELIPTLEMLLKTNGAVLIKEHSLYRIEPESAATINAPGASMGLAGQAIPPGYQIRVVPLRYVGVAEMQKVIEPMMPPKSVIRADENRNLLLIAGTSDELDSVLDTIRIFDVDFMRGMSVGLFPLKNVDAATVAEELDKLLIVSGKGPMGGMFRLMPIERLQAILAVTPQPRYLDEIRSWIERLDRYNTTKSGNLHVYRVQNVDALELANTLGQIFGQGGGRSRTPGASLAPGMAGASMSGGTGAASGSFDTTAGGTSGFGSSSTGLGASTSGFGSTSPSGMGAGIGSTTGTGSSSVVGTGGSSGIGSIGSSSYGVGGGRPSGMGASGFGSSGIGSSGFGGGLGGAGRSRGAAMVDLGNNMRVVADPSNNALIIMAKAQDYKDIEAVIKELDVLPLQVLIDATIVEVTLDGVLQYGIKWLFNHDNGKGAGALGDIFSSGSSGTSGTSGSTGTAIVNATTAALAAAGTGGFGYAFAGGDIKLVINALAQQNKINIISSPSLMVLNNQEAAINVGDKLPTSTGGGVVTSTGQVQSPGVQYIESGVTLKVRPRVNSGGLVVMDIIQTISTPSRDPSSTSTVPLYDLTQRQIQSQVAVTNGETLALGGLIQNTDTNGKSGVPILSDLPWLGSLFGGTNKEVKRTELVVLLTPRVVEKRQDMANVTNEFRKRLTGLYEQRDNPSPVVKDQGYSPNQP